MKMGSRPLPYRQAKTARIPAGRGGQIAYQSASRRPGSGWHGCKARRLCLRLSAIAGGCAFGSGDPESRSRRRCGGSVGGSWLTSAAGPDLHLSDPGSWHIPTVQVLSMKPGEFAVGSGQSRAAARALLERRRAGRKRIDVVSSIPRPAGDGEIRIGTWTEGSDGTLFRFSSLPPGMTIGEAERIVSQPGWKPTVPPQEPKRTRPPLKPEW